MSEKILNTRIIHKHDVEANWLKAINFIPKQGEIIVYDRDDTHNYERLKIGDGETLVSDLPFCASSWETLADKPIVMETITITYDGSTDGYVTSNPAGLYKVSDFVLAKENVIGQSVSISNHGSVQTFAITEDSIMTFGDANTFSIGDYIICVAEDNTIINDSITFPEKGVYFIKYGNLYVSSLVAENVAQVFDEKYIPFTIARKEDIVQSDWSESNELYLSYVKNKTHYFYNGATVVDRCAFTVSTEDDYVRLSSYVTLVEGKKYRVVIDDATDICEAVHVYDAAAAKNYIELVSNIPEFESITSNLSGSMMSKIYGASLGDHVISIYEDNELKQLDEMFIPDTIARISDISEHNTNEVAHNDIRAAISNLGALVGDTAVSEQITEVADTKMNKSNPVGTGSLSMNRKSGSNAGISSTTLGYNGSASGQYALAEGAFTSASGYASHAEGYNTNATRHSQHVEGQYNILDTEGTTKGKYVHIVGNGTALDKRSNAHTLDWNGLGWFADGVKVGGTGQDDENAKELATQEYVLEQIDGMSWLKGTTNDITPAEVALALDTDCNVLLICNHPQFGVIWFTSFNFSEDRNAVFSSGLVNIDGVWTAFQLEGHVESGAWQSYTVPIALKTDIPAVPDKAELVNDVIAALGTPVFGRVDNENNIILTGALADGTYTLKYEDADGNVTEIGKIITAAFTNLADPASEDWLYKYRFKSDTSLISDGGCTHPDNVVTNYIPVKQGDVVRVKGLNIRVVTADVTPVSTTNTRSAFYNASKTVIGSVVPNNVSACVESGDMWTYTIAEGVSGIDASQIAFIRFNGTLYSGYTANDVIITVNEEIT